MERFIKALTSIINEGDVRKNPSTYQGNLDGAPREVQALIEALTTRSYNVGLGQYAMNEPCSMGEKLWHVAEEIEQSLDMVGSSLEELLPGFNPTKTVLLSADRGGNSMVAISWGRDKLEGIVVEHADPTEENVVQFFDQAEAFIRCLDDYHGNYGGDPQKAAGLRATEAALDH